MLSDVARGKISSLAVRRSDWLGRNDSERKNQQIRDGNPCATGGNSNAISDGTQRPYTFSLL